MSIWERIPVCPHGRKEMVGFFLMTFLGWVEAMVEGDLNFSSGYRCVECNRTAGGAENSAHLRGKAVDIVPMSPEQRYEILAVAFLRGIKRIGIEKDHVHLDVDESLPQGVLWVE